MEWSKKMGIRLSRTQLILWGASVGCILVAGITTRTSSLSLCASVVGVTSLIFAAVGGLLGPLLMIAFSVLYGIISWQLRYYGEVITYLGMTAPMSLLALLSWAKHPSDPGSGQVRVARLTAKDIAALIATAVAVTICFRYILEALGTANLLMSTVSVTTSYIAVYLTWRRSSAYALGYAANDIVLIMLWGKAALTEPELISVVVCFAVFLINDLYGYSCWRKMQREQERKRDAD